jgi:hypothetical protein
LVPEALRRVLWAFDGRAFAWTPLLARALFSRFRRPTTTARDRALDAAAATPRDYGSFAAAHTSDHAL